MTISHGEVLDTAIAQLRTLAAFLGEQLGEGGEADTAYPAALELRACREALVSISELMRKLQACAAVPDAEAHIAEVQARLAQEGRI